MSQKYFGNFSVIYGMCLKEHLRKEFCDEFKAELKKEIKEELKKEIVEELSGRFIEKGEDRWIEISVKTEK